MPPAKRKNFEKRPQWRSHAAGTADDQQAEELAIVPLARITAAERREIYARVLWLHDYKLVFDAETEANAESVRALMVQYTSAHTSRLMRRDTPEGHCAARAVEMRLRDCVGFLERSRNRLHVPISQAAKAIVYLCSGVKAPVWNAERMARRVVKREYAVELLRQMALCRPPPPFEVQQRATICSIAFDQTYAKAGSGTGKSA